MGRSESYSSKELVVTSAIVSFQKKNEKLSEADKRTKIFARIFFSKEYVESLNKTAQNSTA